MGFPAETVSKKNGENINIIATCFSGFMNAEYPCVFLPDYVSTDAMECRNDFWIGNNKTHTEFMHLRPPFISCMLQTQDKQSHLQDDSEKASEH